ncbi:NAD(P)/FAD-dependent oxidoreductase [Rhodocista pekingensis]|uniref:NAD(P)/FAD-dependent oxidoreductase n=1 Tax=Rhodocista pekingensis TaxID=201185 RepID=A0ABW2KSI4_9PROT
MPKSYPRSWYADTADIPTRRPPLTGDVRCDVCIVGAGYTGLVTAIELAQRGYDVVVLEAERIGWGASGRNGGQIVTGFNKSIGTIAGWVGREDAVRLWHLSEEAKTILADLVDRFGIECDLHWGYLLAALKKRQMDELEAWREELAGLGYDRTRLLDQEQTRAEIATNAYVGSVLDEGSGHLHPLRYVLGLARAAESLGVRIFEGSRVLHLETGAAPQAETKTGRVLPRFLVLAGNAYLGRLVPEIAGRIMPVATYIIGTEPLGEERARALIPSGHAVADTNFVLNYYRRSPDHRFLFGGGVSYSGLDRPDLKQALRRTMLRFFPQLEEARIDYCWGGHVAITMDRTPHVGRIGPATYYAQGYSGHGVAMTAICGRLMAEAIAGQAERFDVFARIPHAPFPGGGSLRKPALVLAMMWYRMRDLL